MTSWKATGKTELERELERQCTRASGGKCPLCGAPTNWRDLLQQKRDSEPAWRPWKRRKYRTMGFGAERAVELGAEYERRRPVRDPTLESDVMTPGLQSAISGVVGAVLSGTISAAAGWGKPWAIAAAGGAGVLALTWAALLKDHRQLLWEVERITGADLDQDGVVGRADPVDAHTEPQITRIEISEPGRGRIRFVDVPLSDVELERVAHSVLVAREPFSQRGLDDILSQDQYTETYEAMLEGGLLRYKGKSPRAGVELTGAGRAFLEQYLDGDR